MTVRQRVAVLSVQWRRASSTASQNPTSSSSTSLLRTQQRFRVFGPKFTPEPHQYIMFLRKRRLPHKWHGHNILQNGFMAFWHGVSGLNGTTELVVPPSKDAVLFNLRELALYANAVHGSGHGEKEMGDGDGSSARQQQQQQQEQHHPPCTISSSAHPVLFAAEWAVSLYCNFWLRRLGYIYRFLRDTKQGSDVLKDEMWYYYPMLFPKGMLRIGIVNIFQKQLRCFGCPRETIPAMEAHFERLCNCLEDYLLSLGYGSASESVGGCEGSRSGCAGGAGSVSETGWPSHGVAGSQQSHVNAGAGLHEDASARAKVPRPFLLGTPHPTLADVTLASYFTAYFLMDDPPRGLLLTDFPAIVDYVDRVGGEGEGGDAAGQPDGERGVVTAEYKDELPDALGPVLEVMAEVSPLLAAQCERVEEWLETHLESVPSQRDQQSGGGSDAVAEGRPAAAAATLKVGDTGDGSSSDSSLSQRRQQPPLKVLTYHVLWLTVPRTRIIKLTTFDDGRRGFVLPQFVHELTWEMVYGNYVVYSVADLQEVDLAQTAFVEVNEAFRRHRGQSLQELLERFSVETEGEGGVDSSGQATQRPLPAMLLPHLHSIWSCRPQKFNIAQIYPPRQRSVAVIPLSEDVSPRN